MSGGMKKPQSSLVEELEKLRVQAAPFEARGQYDTAHHKMIRRLELELALLEAGPVTAKSRVASQLGDEEE